MDKLTVLVTVSFMDKNVDPIPNAEHQLNWKTFCITNVPIAHMLPHSQVIDIASDLGVESDTAIVRAMGAVHDDFQEQYDTVDFEELKDDTEESQEADAPLEEGESHLDYSTNPPTKKLIFVGGLERSPKGVDLGLVRENEQKRRLTDVSLVERFKEDDKEIREDNTKVVK